jgi:hypothetical protein
MSNVILFHGADRFFNDQLCPAHRRTSWKDVFEKKKEGKKEKKKKKSHEPWIDPGAVLRGKAGFLKNGGVITLS